MATACAAIEHVLGYYQDARARLLAALGELPHDSALASTVKGELAANAMFVNQFDQACVLAREAYDSASRDVSDRPQLVGATVRAAFVEAWVGRTERAQAYRTEAVSLVDALADASLARYPALSYGLGYAELFLDRLDDAIRHFERGIALSRSSGQGQLVLPLMTGLQSALTERGRLAEATELGKAALEGARLSGNDQLLVSVLGVCCWTATGAGELQAALRFGRESLEVADKMGQKVIPTVGAYTTFAGALLQSGQVEQCRTLLLESLGGPELPRLSARARCAAYAMLTEAELALGRPGAASEWIQRSETTASRLGLPVPTSAARRSRVLLLLASGEAEAAAELALTAATEAASVGASVDAARARLLAGRALAQAGKRDHSLTELERAAEELAACGAEGYRQQAVRELRRLGRRVPSHGNRPRSNGQLSDLSAREREIAEMVSAGRTNREIADRLYLSIKTVERHLSHIFAKLGVRSRAAVAGLVARQERGSPALEPENGSVRPPSPSSSNGSSRNGSQSQVTTLPVPLRGARSNRARR